MEEVETEKMAVEEEQKGRESGSGGGRTWRPGITLPYKPRLFFLNSCFQTAAAVGLLYSNLGSY